MEKIQVLLPAPQMRRLRQVAKSLDTPMSDLIRRATEAYLDRLPARMIAGGDVEIPTFNGGRTLTAAAAMRDIAYDDRMGTSHR